MAFIMGDPEEIKRHQEEMLDGVRMAREVAGNEIKDLMQHASEEHLHTIKKILHQIGCEDSSPAAAYYEGMVTASLLSRFDVCLACGEIHPEVDALLTHDTEDDTE